MNLIFIGMGLCWLAIGLEGWLLTQLLRQNGRLLLRVEAIEEVLEQRADAQAHIPASFHAKRALKESKINRDGLPAGTPAPDFRLPRLDGGELSLSEYWGQKVMLVFSDPHCGPCEALAPELEQAHRQNPEVQVLMVSRGEVSKNRKKVKQYQLSFPIVLQRKWEISRLYAMFATPIGYLIDEQGVMAADVAVGADAILGLLSGAATSKEMVSIP
ncbi:MAG TPA: peroxiredoxin family protein [Chthonomonadaceae bacterium]|nr:peroxiredoxin family protein [Chthonomonadaceae bacterium]